MKLSLAYILPFLLVMFMFSSCEEGEHSMVQELKPSEDFRSSFEGMYGGSRTCSTSLPNDTIWTGELNMGKDTLVVLIDQNSTDSIWINNWHLPISENGYFSANNELPGIGFFSARFHHDTLKVQAFNYSTGSSTGCTWKTVKLK